MQKVYLLLRANSQNGPFTLNELLQFTLTPYDLVWIEGKSAGWYYPQEIEALRPHLPFLNAEQPQQAQATIQSMASQTETTAPKKIFVSMPAAMAKEEAKPQSMPAPSFAPQQKAPAIEQPLRSEAAEIKTVHTKPLEEVEANYMNQAYQKKTAKKKPVFSRSGLVVLCLLSGALFATWKIANRPKTEAEDAASLQQTTPSVAQPVSVTTNSKAEEKPAAQKAVSSPSLKKENGNKTILADKTNALPKEKPVVKQEAIIKPQGKEPAPADDYAKESGDHKPASVAKEEAVAPVEEKSEPASTEAPKKKKLRDKIFDIFRKKQPEEKSAETKPAESGDGNRQSTRREAGSSLAQLVTVKFEIPNDWMMGIKGARAMLTNKSSEPILKAVVEVRYYNDDNDLLAKKTVVFTNVKSKSTQTASVPDHGTATRLEYSVVSAVGEGDAVARL